MLGKGSEVAHFLRFRVEVKELFGTPFGGPQVFHVPVGDPWQLLPEVHVLPMQPLPPRLRIRGAHVRA